MDFKNFYMFRRNFSTKLLLMKTPVALESTNACIENNLEVPVVLKKTSRYSDVL